MEIKFLEGDALDEAYPIWMQAFTQGDRGAIESWKRDADPFVALGGYESGRLQATATIAGFTMLMGGEEPVPMGGLAAVACLPAMRGRGFTAALLRRSLEVMREQGQSYSYLWPFAYAFYRRHGWEWAAPRRVYTAPSRLLPLSPETRSVRAALPEDRTAVEALYGRFASRYRGAILRGAARWNGILNDTDKRFTYTYLYERDGACEGYLTYREGNGECTEIREFIAETPRARRGLLGLLRRHAMQTKAFSWQAPMDDPFWHELMDHEVRTELKPGPMGRVVDIAQAAVTWRPAANVAGEVTLRLTDDAAPWNAGTWRIEYAQGRASAARSNSDPQVSLDIQALSQLAVGAATFTELRATDRLEVSHNAGAEAAAALFAGPPAWNNDFF